MPQTIDITREHCPMTMVKVKLKLASLASGDELDVLVYGDEPLSNIPRTAKEEGHEVLCVEQAGQNHRILIRKK
ncbi:MAG: sulfurtransferase TusA family protein [Chitinivibrionales bacterium]|nr:sulfurtransferase TusA family protein [Chitinivibrionales bacterium]